MGIMGKPHALAIALLGLLVALGWFLTRSALDPAEREVQVTSEEGQAAEELEGTGIVGGPVSPAPPLPADPDAVVRENVVYTPRDVEIFQETMQWARESRLDTLEFGDAIVRIGRRFVGEPYTPHTLELPGPERLVVNLREFDCVTFLENALAFARMVRSGQTEFGAFTAELRRIRYRNGEIDGYPSRLHYFSEWIADNDQMGLVEDITRSLGGVPDDERIDFMSTHADAYVQLDGHPERIREIRGIEQRLSSRTRYYIPQSEIAAAAPGIRNGDIIAATSNLAGLDVAHTGMAIWLDGALHLMHAPLVGKSVEISVRPLASRIQRIEGQDGIMVARPL